MITIADVLGRAIIHQPAWYNCRRCQQPFRSSAYWDLCWWCWHDDHPTRPA